MSTTPDPMMSPSHATPGIASHEIQHAESPCILRGVNPNVPPLRFVRQGSASRLFAGDRGLRMPSGPSPIGIDVGDRFLVVAQVQGQLEGMRTGVASLRIALKLHREAPGPITSGEARALVASLRRSGVRERDVVLGADDATLMSGLLELPPRSSKAPVDEIARMELARMHRINPDSFVMAYWDLPASDRGKSATHAVGIGLALTSQDASIDALEGAGLSVGVVDARMCALARGVASAIGTCGALVGVVELGWNATQVLLLHSAGNEWTIAYERRVPEVCLAQLVDALRTRLGLDADAAELALRGGGPGADWSGDGDGDDPKLRELIRAMRRSQSDFFDRVCPEVQRSLVYATQRYPQMPLASVHLVGEGAGVRGLRTRLAQVMGVECGAIGPRDVVRMDESSSLATDGAVLVATSLACHRAMRNEGAGQGEGHARRRQA